MQNAVHVIKKLLGVASVRRILGVGSLYVLLASVSSVSAAPICQPTQPGKTWTGYPYTTYEYTDTARLTSSRSKNRGDATLCRYSTNKYRNAQGVVTSLGKYTFDIIIRDRLVPEEPNSWVVMLLGANTGFVCTGSAIAPDWIMTARHCLNGVDPTLYYPVGGGTSQYTQSEMSQGSQLYTHPSSDLVLLRLRAPLVLQRYGMPGASFRFDSTKRDVTQMGWGTQSGVLDVRAAKIFDADNCTVNALSDGVPFLFGGVCLTPGSVPGDSGGPIMYKGYIAGVLSLTFVRRLDFAVDVSESWQWLNQTTGGAFQKISYQYQ